MAVAAVDPLVRHVLLVNERERSRLGAVARRTERLPVARGERRVAEAREIDRRFLFPVQIEWLDRVTRQLPGGQPAD